MIEFENIVFMDFQKAATTSIVGFLEENLDDKLIKKSVHRPAEKGHDIRKFHFISVRNPLNTYISLFGHGCKKRGGMYKGFEKRGLDHLYVPTLTGFQHWLDFMLEPKNAWVIKKKYAIMGLSDICGPLTYRLLMLSIVDPISTLKKCKNDKRHDIAKFFYENRIYDYYVRTEELANDLFAMLTGHADRVKLKDPLTTLDDLRARIPRKNAGRKIDGLTSDAVSAELRARLREYEWLLYETFGYDEGTNGNPPPLSPLDAFDGSHRAPWRAGEPPRASLEVNSR